MWVEQASQRPGAQHSFREQFGIQKPILFSCTSRNTVPERASIWIHWFPSSIPLVGRTFHQVSTELVSLLHVRLIRRYIWTPGADSAWGSWKPGLHLILVEALQTMNFEDLVTYSLSRVQQIPFIYNSQFNSFMAHKERPKNIKTILMISPASPCVYSIISS